MMVSWDRPSWCIAALIAVIHSLAALSIQSEPERINLVFDLGDGQVATDAVPIKPMHVYRDDSGYGFEGDKKLSAIQVGPDALTGDAITSDQPYFFSIKLPEGNYRITLTLGGHAKSTEITVKAENRRLMAYQIKTRPGQTREVSFAVNTRTARIDENSSVALNAREYKGRNWDDKLTLEFNGTRPTVSAIRIQSEPDIQTIYLAGDSTVTDQPNEPWSGWGQMLPYFFDDKVAVANHAESGRTLRSFAAQRRLRKIISQLKAGDFVFIQFGHNDMKQQGEGFGPYQNYSRELHDYIKSIRGAGATPILVTPMYRRSYNENGELQATHGDYPDAMRKVARQADVLVIDLHEMSGRFYDALGREGSKRAFVHYPANTFPGQDQAWKDNSHHSPYGAYQLARCVVAAIQASDLDALKSRLRPGIRAFDPSRPDDPKNWDWPQTPLLLAPQKPEGS